MVENSPERLDGVFQALANQTRRSILAQLSDGEKLLGEVAAPYDMSLAAVAKHVDVLARAGLVSRTRHGRTTRCRLNPAALSEATDLLERYRAFWHTQIDSLDRYFAEKKLGGDGGD